MVAGTVWFFQASVEGWVALTGGVGIDWQTFAVPFVYLLGVGKYLVPLGVLRFCFWSRERPEPVSQATVAVTIVALTLFIGVGIVAAAMGIRLPGS